jgi:hypothetical protein
MLGGARSGRRHSGRASVSFEERNHNHFPDGDDDNEPGISTEGAPFGEEEYDDDEEGFEEEPSEEQDQALRDGARLLTALRFPCNSRSSNSSSEPAVVDNNSKQVQELAKEFFNTECSLRV